MTERKYSVAEIDRMRIALLRRMPDPGRILQGDTMEILQLRAHQYAMRIEDQLRTHMLNGTEPDELERAQP